MSIATATGIVTPSFIRPFVVPLGTPGWWTWIGHFCLVVGDGRGGGGNRKTLVNFIRKTNSSLWLMLENHRVRVVPPNSGNSLVSQDNECWEVNKGLQTHRIQNTVFTLTIKSEPFCFWNRIPWLDHVRPVRPDDVHIRHF